MPKFVLFSILFVVCSINGLCQDEGILVDGYHIFRYPNGSISSEGTLKDGKPEGYWKSYYITGILKSEGKRTNNLLDSVWVFYDVAGDTTEKINYLYGKKNGYHYKYKKDPSYGLYVESKELNAGDKIEGNAYIFYPDGQTKQIIPYKSNKKDGLSKEFDQDGNIITLLEYNNDRLITRERINRIDNDGMKQGTWKEFYQSGSLKKEENFKDNNLHGFYREYDMNGRVVTTLLYENGSIVESAQNGETEINIVNRYDQENRLIYSGPYRDNVPVGVHREYGPDGTITKSNVYNDNGLLLSEGIVDASGNRNGNWKEFFPNGLVMAEGQYNNNVRVGSWKFYNSKGSVEQTGSYNNGRPDGTWTWYYENNAILREEEYYRGQRDGIYREYSEDGEIIVQGEYSDGEKNGFWKYNTGDVIEEGEYIVGLKEGEWKTYYPDGKLKYKGEYVQGNAEGLHQFFFENGNLKEEQYYKMGLKQKTWRKYDETGVVTLSITYRNDMETSINGIRVNLPESDVRLID